MFGKLSPHERYEHKISLPIHYFKEEPPKKTKEEELEDLRIKLGLDLNKIKPSYNMMTS